MSEGSELYFAPLLAWQGQAWEQVTRQFDDGKLPHGLLVSGMAGIGKRAFVWRWVAWLLCHDKSHDGACGACDSCTWLKAGTHPDLMVLPATSLPTADTDDKASIKIDDIRALQEYSHIKGHGVRLMVLDHAETMTQGASNALLKTLEEPRDGVHLILISDNPSRLAPTIKSRVQALPLAHIEREVALAYLGNHLDSHWQAFAPMLLDLADGAVLRAVELPKTVWFGERLLWLKTFVALRQGKRSAVSASDYWQALMGVGDFITLSRVMMADMVKVALGLPSLHQDLPVADFAVKMTLDDVERLMAGFDEVAVSLGQNVQEKVVYDKLFDELSGF